MSKSIVAIERGEDNLVLLETIAEKAGFWTHLEAAWQASGKPRNEYRIAIKPNLMIFMSRDVPEVATDPELVEHLVRLIHAHGFQTVAVVESQNTMGNWLHNRSVANVARVAGYTSQDYPFIDLTLEMKPHLYKARGLPDWKNFVGRTWSDADYRIDFAKFKTQLDNYFTLCLKNQFGTLPQANKYWHYHTRIPYWACTFYTLVNFPVSFGFVDAYRASDGTAGFALQYNPKVLKMMLASSNIIALDLVGAGLMSIDPWDSPLVRFTMQQLGEPEYEVIGDQTPIKDWENVPDPIQAIVDVGQSVYLMSNIGASAGLLNVDNDEFPPRVWFVRYYYQILNQFFLIINGKTISRSQREMVHSVMKTEQISQQRARH